VKTGVYRAIAELNAAFETVGNEESEQLGSYVERKTCQCFSETILIGQRF
jgi:hypothetical protein